MTEQGFSLDVSQVRGDIFKESGKWAYTVQLDYSECDWDNWQLQNEARKALRDATRKGTSGVTFEQIHEGWFMVVLHPYAKSSYPIVVWREGTPGKA